MTAPGAVQPTPNMKQAKQVLLFALIELECICDAQNNMLLRGLSAMQDGKNTWKAARWKNGSFPEHVLTLRMSRLSLELSSIQSRIGRRGDGCGLGFCRGRRFFLLVSDE